MKKYIIPVLALLSVGCTKNFEEYNTNPYGVNKEEYKRSPIGGNELLQLQSLVLPQQENSYQMCFDLAATPYAGYAGTQTNFNKNYPSYNPPTGWTDYLFNDTYPKIYTSYFALKNYANGDVNKTYFALGTVLRVAITHWLTDTYGPLPYSQMEVGKTKVAYDNQRDLYINMCNELKAVIPILKNTPATDRQYKEFDLVYDGDMHKWAKYASSLLLRLSIRMSDVAETEAKEYAQFALNSGVITSNAENPMFKNNDNPVKKMADWNDSCTGADIVEYMRAFSDPRVEKFFIKAATSTAVTQEYIGLRIGYEENVDSKIKSNNTIYSRPNVERNSPINWITAAEVAFIKAEMALKGWNFVGDTAENLYKQGVKLSFAQHGVGGADTYLNVTTTRGDFVDPKQPRYNGTFSSTITVKWNTTDTDEQKLAKIITQKWISMYPYNSHEAWAEWRRTGYPNLMPPMQNKSGGVITTVYQVNGKDKGGMRRLPYSSSETTNNGANKNAAVGYLGGADNGATDLWWVRR